MINSEYQNFEKEESDEEGKGIPIVTSNQTEKSSPINEKKEDLSAITDSENSKDEESSKDDLSSKEDSSTEDDQQPSNEKKEKSSISTNQPIVADIDDSWM